MMYVDFTPHKVSNLSTVIMTATMYDSFFDEVAAAVQQLINETGMTSYPINVYVPRYADGEKLPAQQWQELLNGIATDLGAIVSHTGTTVGSWWAPAQQLAIKANSETISASEWNSLVSAYEECINAIINKAGILTYNN